MSNTQTNMNASRNIHLTILERLDLIPALTILLGSLVYNALTAPLRGNSGAHTYKQHVLHALVRKFTTRFTTRQAQYLSPTFGSIYTTWCKNNSQTPNFIQLPKSNCQAFWTGNPSIAKYVLIYFHGGGFSLDGDDNHLNYWYGVQKDLSASSGIEMAMLFVEYTLVPHGTYPIQMREAIEALQYVLDSGRRPSQILVGGDSAGGNIALAVLSHLTHPSPQCEKVDIKEPLEGLVLVAPWVSFQTTFPSITRNANKDIVAREGGIMWSSTYLAGVQGGNYAEPHQAPPSWWEGMWVEEIICVAGSDEILIDPISEWVEKYKSVNPKSITFVVGKNETHIAPIFNPGFGDKEETEQGKALKAWLKARL